MNAAQEAVAHKRSFWGKQGPIDGVAADPVYLDVSISQDREKPCLSRPPATLMLMSSPAQLNSAMPPVRLRYQPKESHGLIPLGRLLPIIVRWLFATGAMRWRCRLARMVFDSFMSPANHWVSP